MKNFKRFWRRVFHPVILQYTFKDNESDKLIAKTVKEFREIAKVYGDIVEWDGKTKTMTVLAGKGEA